MTNSAGSSSRVAVIARLKSKPGSRREMLDALGALVVAAENEPGTLAYVFHEALDDPDVIWAYELYENQEALDSHSASPAMAEMIGTIGHLVAEAPQLNVARPAQGYGIAP